MAGAGWQGIDLDAPHATGSPETQTELDELHELVEYRAGILAEAAAQSGAFLDYFTGLFGFAPASHPRTFDLAWAALRVGQFMAMRLKRRYDRPRPSMVCPSLLPPIDPPPHSSYPSGHAAEAHLVALCLSAVMPAEAKVPLRAMAERIARNREVIGLHYRSDSVAGVDLAKKTAPSLLACAAVVELVNTARVEWGQPVPPPA